MCVFCFCCCFLLLFVDNWIVDIYYLFPAFGEYIEYNIIDIQKHIIMRLKVYIYTCKR